MAVVCLVTCIHVDWATCFRGYRLTREASKLFVTLAQTHCFYATPTEQNLVYNVNIAEQNECLYQCNERNKIDIGTHNNLCHDNL